MQWLILEFFPYMRGLQESLDVSLPYLSYPSDPRPRPRPSLRLPLPLLPPSPEPPPPHLDLYL